MPPPLPRINQQNIPVTALSSIINVPVGRPLSKQEQTNRNRRKTGLHLSAKDQTVQQRLKQGKLNRQDDMREASKLKRRQIESTIQDRKRRAPLTGRLNKQVSFQSIIKSRTELDRMLTTANQEPPTPTEQVRMALIEPQAKNNSRVDSADLQSTEGNMEINDNIMVQVLCTISEEFPDAHIVSPKFIIMLQAEGWDFCKKFFRNQDRDLIGNLRDRDKQLPSQDAAVLIFSIHTPGHWIFLVCDACGVDANRARWRFFDTFILRGDSTTRSDRIKNAIITTDLWKDGMSWEAIDTPQQGPRTLDCGALVCVMAVAYMRWSS
jgi:hypothetical protein